MAKNSVDTWDTNPDLNTDVANINIDEGCAPSGINNAIRAVMAQIKTWYTSITGTITTIEGNVTTIQGDITTIEGNLTTIEGDVTAASPIGVVQDFAGGTAPDRWLLCYGQAISRTTYAALYAVIGTTFGAGDGSTTFNVPDLRGRVTAGQDNMGGNSAGRLNSGAVAGTTLGAAGGAETHTLTEAEMPSHDHTSGSLATGSAGAHNHGIGDNPIGAVSSGTRSFLGNTDNDFVTTTDGEHTHDVSGSTGSAGSDDAHNNVQPTMIMNKIIRALA